MKWMLMCFASVVCMTGAQAKALDTFTLHGAPQGVRTCTVPSTFTPYTIGSGLCPAISFQTHWKPGGGSPVVQPPNTLTANLAHTHIECNLPYLAEVNMPFTVPCRFVLFHTAGSIGLAQGDLVSALTFDNPQVRFPLVGDPSAILNFNFHLTFDPRIQKNTNVVPPHGYFVLRFMCRTAFTNQDTMDTQMEWSAFSVLDVTQPEPAAYVENEPMVLTSKAVAFSARDTEANVYGIHLVRLIGDNIPLWAPFDKPFGMLTDSYSYGPDIALPAGSYQLVYNPDLHNANSGAQGAFNASPAAGGSRNYDYVDPLAISQAPLPAGFTKGQGRISVLWEVDTDSTKSILGDRGGLIAPNQSIVSLVSFSVALGPNPEGCSPATCPPLTSPPGLPVGNAPPTSPPSPPTPPPAAVPNVVGTTQVAATSALTAAGFTVRTVSTASSSTVAVGLVLSQNPAAGTSVPAGTPVDLVVSRGVPRTTLSPTVHRSTTLAPTSRPRRRGIPTDR